MAYTPNFSQVVTRFAPSPTGYLHIGGVRTALFNWLYAKQNSGQFILRVEDTDQNRNNQEAIEHILQGLTWCGLTWDNQVEVANKQAYQSQRTALYQSYFERLQEQDKVYQQGGAWFFRFERYVMQFQDEIRGEVSYDYNCVDNTPDLVVKRSDGSFTFHFVNVVDDIAMQVSHVIRGEDHLTNTFKHIQLFQAFNAPLPTYAHLPLILEKDGSKMSKRNAAAAIQFYQEAGFLPEALCNYLSLLGWSHPEQKEILSMTEIIENLTLASIHKGGAQFDVAKCSWVNQQHILNMPLAELAEKAKPYITSAALLQHPQYQQITASVAKKITQLDQINDLVQFFITRPTKYAEKSMTKLVANSAINSIQQQVITYLTAVNDWNDAMADLRQYAKQQNIPLGTLFPLLRLALSGLDSGPDIDIILMILGKEEVLFRLQQFSAK